jgi:hypothetical protein
LSKKEGLNIYDIKLRKKKLQDEIQHIEDKYSRKASKISGGIQSTLKPIQKIKKHPLKAVAASIAFGLIIGVSGRRKSKSKSESKTQSPDSDADDYSGRESTGFTSHLISELKRMAAKRAIVYISEFVDRKVMPGKTASLSETSHKETPS